MDEGLRRLAFRREALSAHEVHYLDVVVPVALGMRDRIQRSLCVVVGVTFGANELRRLRFGADGFDDDQKVRLVLDSGQQAGEMLLGSFEPLLVRLGVVGTPPSYAGAGSGNRFDGDRNRGDMRRPCPCFKESRQDDIRNRLRLRRPRR